MTTQGTVVSQDTVGQTFPGAQVMTDIVSHAGHQYVAWYTTPDRNVAVRHRTIDPSGDGPWSDVHYIAESYYNPDDYGVNHSYHHDWDSHCWIRMGIDDDGNLHLAVDHHVNQLRYFRTSTPGDLTTLARHKNIVDENFEKQVTYPEFINNANGHMRWLMFRDGTSGAGRTRLYQWNDTNNTWSQNCVLFGETNPSDGSNYNAYTETFFNPDDGWFHIVFCWRRTANADSCSRLCYVKTQDFQTFYNDAGKVQSLPIFQEDTGCIVDDIAEGNSSFYNNEWQFGQIGSQKFIAYSKSGNVWAVATPTGGGQFGTPTRLTSVGDVGGFGNGFIDNYLTVMPDSTLSADFSLGNRGPTRRVSFGVGSNWSSGAPNLPVTVPPQYEPDAVYQTPDTQPGIPEVYFRTRADSRTNIQTGGVYSRDYIASRPANGLHYVMGNLCGPDVFQDPNTDSDPSNNYTQAEFDAWPTRPVVVTKVTYL